MQKNRKRKNRIEFKGDCSRLKERVQSFLRFLIVYVKIEKAIRE